MSDIAIRVDNLGKQYRIGRGEGKASYKTLRESISGAVINPFRWLGRNGRSHEETIWALKDVSFEVKQGESIGIIGRNGAGKSTLLKILSRITEPTCGTVDLYGRVGSLLEVGTGFHPELSGRENIYLNGAILGMRRAEIDRKFDEVVDFAEIEKFIDTPVKHYSSGMYLRLAFAVAAHMETEILLVDEVLAVGDAGFQKKCLGKMDDVAKQGRTVLFVSHNMGAIKGLCRLAILLENGKATELGLANKVIDKYLDSGKERKPFVELPDDPKSSIQINSVSICDKQENIAGIISTDELFYISICFSVKKEISQSYIALHIHDNDLNTLIFLRDFEINEDLLNKRKVGAYQYTIEIPSPLMVPGKYCVSVHAVIVGAGTISRMDYGCSFDVVDSGSVRAKKGYQWIGKINPSLKLHITELPTNSVSSER